MEIVKFIHPLLFVEQIYYYCFFFDIIHFIIGTELYNIILNNV